MNPNQTNPSAEAREAQLTAYLLGELAPAEARLLTQQLATDQDLRKLHDQLKLACEWIRQADARMQMAPEKAPKLNPKSAPAHARSQFPEDGLRLSPGRREQLQAKFKTVPFSGALPRRSRPSWIVPIAAAALLMVFAGSLFLPALGRAKAKGVRGQMPADPTHFWRQSVRPSGPAPEVATLGELTHTATEQSLRLKDVEAKIAVDDRRQLQRHKAEQQFVTVTPSSSMALVLPPAQTENDGFLSIQSAQRNENELRQRGRRVTEEESFGRKPGVAERFFSKAQDNIAGIGAEAGGVLAVPTVPLAANAVSGGFGGGGGGTGIGGNGALMRGVTATKDFARQAAGAIPGKPTSSTYSLELADNDARLIQPTENSYIDPTTGLPTAPSLSSATSNGRMPASQQEIARESRTVEKLAEAESTPSLSSGYGVVAFGGRLQKPAASPGAEISETKRQLQPAEVAQASTVPTPSDAVMNKDKSGLVDLEAAKQLGRGDTPLSNGLKEQLRTELKLAIPAPVPQPEIAAADNPFSTFSLNVSDVSFNLAAASLEKSALPDPASIRTEEFINAFDYHDPEAAAGAPIAFASDQARYPFAQNRDVLRLALKTAAQGRPSSRPLNLVLLVDNSGSMERADRVAILREALKVLGAQLQPQDRLSIITFARTASLRAEGVSGEDARRALERVSGLTPEGGTNLEEAMRLGYEIALKQYQGTGINRVVLLTDGAANLGDVSPERLKAKVEAHRKQGIALDCFGVGWDGYNDDLLEVLSRNGDGRYGFINSPDAAATGFAGQLAGALQVAASDVKVQVQFNPARVNAYRQVGYAKHQLTKEQFRDNTVDAAELGAAEEGNALYVLDINKSGTGDLGVVRVRYKVPGTAFYHEHEWAIPYTGTAPALEQAAPAMRLAVTAAAFAESLAGSPYAGEVTSDRLLASLRGVPEAFGADARPKRLDTMIREAKNISGR